MAIIGKVVIKINTYIIFAVLFLLPLFSIQNFFFQKKFSYILVFNIIILIIYVSGFIFNKKNRGIRIISILFFLFLIWGFTRLFNNIKNVKELYEFYKICYFYFFLEIMLRMNIKFKKIILVFSLGLVCVVFYGFLQKSSFQNMRLILKNQKTLLDMTKEPGSPGYDMEYEQIKRKLARVKSERVFSTFILPNILASYILIVLPFTIYNFISSREKYAKYIYFLLSVSAVILFLMTKTISPLLSLFISFCILLLIKKKMRINSKFIYATILTVILITGYIHFTRGLLHFAGTSIKHHILNYISCFNIWMDNFWIGTGTGTFYKIYPANMMEGSNEIIYAHNYLLQTLAELGIFGGLLLTSIFIRIIYIIAQKIKLQSFINSVIMISALIFIFNNLYSLDAVIPSLICYFAVILSFLVKRYDLKINNPKLNCVVWFIAGIIFVFVNFNLYLYYF